MTPRLWRVLCALAAARALALLHRGQQIGWDELEFFRATKWIGQGLVPFRDFWEHHAPLQWLVFAPFARAVAGGPGAESIVVMRWLQVALWIGVFVLILRLSADSARWAALAFLLVSPTFVQHAVEYRVDVLGNLLFLAGVLFVLRERWFVAGALVAAAVLANMRLAPLAIALALLGIWQFRARALRIVTGAVPVAVAFVTWLFAVHAWKPFLDGVVGYNRASPKIAVHTFFDTLLAPLWALDVAGVVLMLAALIGGVVALRKRESAFVPLLFIASIATVALMDVQYTYHFQLPFLLMVPLAGVAFERLASKWRPVLAAVAAAALVIGLVQMVPRFGEAMEYQNAVMQAVDRLTPPDEKVFDGAGYALRREPAWTYWFLPTGVRLMALEGRIPRYDVMQHPPGAIIADYRLVLYLRQFPDSVRFASQNFVPLYRNLWIPGIAAIVRPTPSRVIWRAPRDGTYEVWASEPLVRHPWFTRPLDLAVMGGDLAIPLARLPRSPATLQWRVDGVVQPSEARTLTVRRGSQVELVGSAPVPTGVLLVPRGVGTLALGPAEGVLF